MTQTPQDELLTKSQHGDVEAADQLMENIYQHLHSVADNLLRQETPNHTLQPTALVNEAYIRMVNQQQADWQGKTHFRAIGARMMRRILVDHARGKKRVKRGRGMTRVELHEDVAVTTSKTEDVLAIDEAIEKLAELDPQQAKIVELRFFGGLTVEEVAETLKTPKRTIEAQWTLLRAWLRRELADLAES